MRKEEKILKIFESMSEKQLLILIAGIILKNESFVDLMLAQLENKNED
jgi:hypothetical protein